MQIIKETIKKVATIKAHAARNAADKTILNEIVFEEGIQPGEVEINSGIESLCKILNGEIHEGYVNHGTDYTRRVQWFKFENICFFEEHYLCGNDGFPSESKVFGSRGELYASV